PGQAALQLAEAVATQHELTQDQRRPAAGEHLGAQRHRAELAVPLHKVKAAFRPGKRKVQNLGIAGPAMWHEGGMATGVGAPGPRLASALGGLRAQLRGELLQAGDRGYDEARRVWNGAIDRCPAAIARCAA